MRQQNAIPSSNMSSHSMHLGVLATAWHAVTTATMFTVYYKPRTSPSEFIIPYCQYLESTRNNHAIRMRFKMRFDDKDTPEQRFTGTIVGVSDIDPNRWAGSKWRSLQVKCNETSSSPQPNRVSPWEIEPATTQPSTAPTSRTKRTRANAFPLSSDSLIITREASVKATAEPSSDAHAVLGSFHGREVTKLNSNISKSMESVSVQKSMSGSAACDNEKNDTTTNIKCRHDERSLSRGFGAKHATVSREVTSWGNHSVDLTSKFDVVGGPCPMNSSHLPIADSSLRALSQSHGRPCCSSENLTSFCGNFSSHQGLWGYDNGKQKSAYWLTCMPPSENAILPLISIAQANDPASNELVKSDGIGSCKIFGIHLDSIAAPSKQEPSRIAEVQI